MQALIKKSKYIEFLIESFYWLKKHYPHAPSDIIFFVVIPISGAYLFHSSYWFTIAPTLFNPIYTMYNFADVGFDPFILFLVFCGVLVIVDSLLIRVCYKILLRICAYYSNEILEKYEPKLLYWILSICLLLVFSYVYILVFPYYIAATGLLFQYAQKIDDIEKINQACCMFVLGCYWTCYIGCFMNYLINILDQAFPGENQNPITPNDMANYIYKRPKKIVYLLAFYLTMLVFGVVKGKEFVTSSNYSVTINIPGANAEGIILGEYRNSIFLADRKKQYIYQCGYDKGVITDKCYRVR